MEKIGTIISKNKKVIIVSLMMILLLFYMLLTIQQVPINNSTLKMIVGISLFVLLISVGAGAYLIFKEKCSLFVIYIIFMAILSLVYLLIFLPGTVPDEANHYWSAYRVSNILLLKFEQFQNANVLARQCDADLYHHMSFDLSWNYYQTIFNGDGLFSLNNQFVEIPYSFVRTSPFSYIISGMGMALARILHLNAQLVFYFGRIFNIGFYITMTALAIKKIPFGKIAMMAISFLPMVLHEVASYAYDSFSIALSIYFVSYVLYLINQKEKLQVKNYLILGVLACLIFRSKWVYFSVIGLVFLIPACQFNISKKKLLIIELSIIGILVIATPVFLKVKFGFESSTFFDGASLYSVNWIVNHPMDMLKLIGRSVIVNAPFYVKSLLGFRLGWFQIGLSSIFFGFYLFILGYAFMKRDNEPEIHFSLSNRIRCIIIVALSVFAIMLSMMISWTTMGSNVIEGVQGRYFLPLLPVAYLIVRNDAIIITSKYDQNFVFLMYFWSVATIVNIVQAIPMS